MVHGGWKDSLDEYIEDVDSDYFKGIEGQIFLSGHTHIQKIQSLDGKTYCNPGSVGQPRDGDRRAAYCVLDKDEVKILRVEYDIEMIANKMKYYGFNDYYYRNLWSGERIGV